MGPRIMDTVFPLQVQKCQMVIYPTNICWPQVKKTFCSSDLLQSRDSRLKYAQDIAVTSQIVDRPKLSLLSFLDSKSIDRLKKSSIDLKPHKRNVMENSKKLFNSSFNLHSFQQIVHVSANGLVLHLHASPQTQNLLRRLPN